MNYIIFWRSCFPLYAKPAGCLYPWPKIERLEDFWSPLASKHSISYPYLFHIDHIHMWACTGVQRVYPWSCIPKNVSNWGFSHNWRPFWQMSSRQCLPDRGWGPWRLCVYIGGRKESSNSIKDTSRFDHKSRASRHLALHSLSISSIYQISKLKVDM